MNTWTMKVGTALLALAAVAHADDMTKKHAAKMDTTKADAGKSETFVLAKDIKWGAAPPDLPKGSELAVLNGDPTKTGPFTMRLKMPDGYKIPPHWHTKDESLTIVSGTLMLYMGDTTKAEPHSLDAGAFHFLPGKMHHAAEAKGETVVQVHGNGPFDIHYLNPADNPNPKTARK